jgi:hypothetical protein
VAVVLLGTGVAPAIAGGAAAVAHLAPGSTRWVRATPPSGLRGVLLRGLSCAAASCLAIGERCAGGSCNGATPQLAVATTTRGRTWARVTAPPSFEFAYQAVSCVSARRCLVGGTLDPTSKHPTAAVAISATLGRSWSTSLITGLGTVITATCASVAVCYAVGYSNPPVSQVAYGQIATSRNGGATWTVRTFPATGDVDGLSCTTPSTCTAFGTSLAGGSSILLHSTNAGATWALRAVPATVGLLRWLSCPAATSCVATSTRASGSNWIDTTHNGGATWAGRPIGTTNVLYAASCASAATCEFVGQGVADPLTATTVDRGATWPLRLLNSFGHGRLWSISCAAGSHCVAVGQTWTHAPADGGPLLLTD